MKTISKIFAISLLMGATALMPVSGVYAEDCSSTNQVSSRAEKISKAGAAAIMAWRSTEILNRLCGTFAEQGWDLTKKVGNQSLGSRLVQQMGFYSPSVGLWNFDVPGLVVDLIGMYDAMHRTGKLSEDIPELQAIVREIGDGEGLEENVAEAMFNPQSVEIYTLKNVGLEALESTPKSPEELIAAAPLIQQGFGTTGGTDACANLTGALRIQCEEVQELTGGQSGGVSDAQRSEHSKRRKAHLQFTGTASVTRSDMATALVAAGREDESTLMSYVGAGDDLVANAKVMAGLDLVVAQRLNLLNMLQGQQTANEAAMALQYVQEQ